MKFLQTASLAWALASFVGGCRVTAAAPRPDAPDLHGLGAALEPSLRQYHVPTVAIAVVDHGKIVLDTVLTDNKSAVPSDTRFEAASLSKPVFATAVVQLARQRVLDLDTPIARYLPWPELHDSRASSITARMILSHTSGAPNVVKTGDARLEFDPGSRWRYSGAAYIHLQRVVEHLTGEPLERVVAQRVFAPLDMRQSSFVDASAPTYGEAVGHDRQGHALPRDRFLHASAAFSLRTTAGDYARFLAAMLGTNDDGPLDAVNRRTLLSSQIVVDSVLSLRWALGWALAPATFFHWGSNPGFKSFVMGDPTRGRGFVMLTDGDNGLELAPIAARVIMNRNYDWFRFYMLHPND